MQNGTSDYTAEVKQLHDLAGQQNKLEQNARGARLELDRRRERNTRWWTTEAVLVAAAIGAVGGIVGAIASSR